jgi:glycosyltransferase involved in cell wall biosynthesis
VRILVLTNQYPPHSIGGYALSCQSIVEHFALRGHSLYVLTSDASLPGVPHDPDEASRGVHRDLYLWFRDLGRREPKIPQPRFRDRLRYERRNQRITRDVLVGWRPDVVSVWEMGAMSLSTLTLVEHAGVPMVLTLHDYWPEYAPGWDPWLRIFELRPWARHFVAPLRIVTTAPELSNALVNVVSHSLHEKTAGASRWQFPDAKVIAFGVDPRLFPVLEPESREWCWRILFVGRLHWLKGLRTLALAMRHLPANASLEVVGKGDPELPAMMKEIIGEPGAGGRVRFSSCQRSELAERYRAADVVVFPSEWDEPFGLVPLEAMACGVPVVATGTGGSGEYLRDGENCLLFPPGDPVRLAMAVQRLARDPALRAKVLVGGSRTAESYSLERCADEIETLHLAAAGLRSEPPR